MTMVKKQPRLGWGLFKGLGVAILVTLAGVAIFALVMQWVRPTEEAVRWFNQLLKLLAVAAGVWAATGKGQPGGLMRGALLGLTYMGLGVAMYALLSGQSASITSYLADLGMGVAGGGLCGMILSNISSK